MFIVYVILDFQNKPGPVDASISVCAFSWKCIFTVRYLNCLARLTGHILFTVEMKADLIK